MANKRNGARSAKPDLEGVMVSHLARLGWRCVEAVEYRATLADKTLPEVAKSRLLVRQHTPNVTDCRTGRKRRYRLDFAHPLSKCALEVDGYNRRLPNGRVGGKGGHITWSGFHSDRERDRYLTLGGWRVLRCGPGDLKLDADATAIAQQFTTLIEQVIGRENCNGPK